MRGFYKVVLTLSLLVFTTGCANRATAKVDPSVNFSAIKTMHVIKLPEEKDGISTGIADHLRQHGYTVTTSTDKPQNTVDAIVTYYDKWMWDITMYMLELTVNIRDGKTEIPIAVGNSMHGSLTRKSPSEMVNEVMNNIFKEANK